MILNLRRDIKQYPPQQLLRHRQRIIRNLDRVQERIRVEEQFRSRGTLELIALQTLPHRLDESRWHGHVAGAHGGKLERVVFVDDCLAAGEHALDVVEGGSAVG